MIKVLVSFSDDWADEMDIDGFTIMEKEEWLKIEEKLKQHDEEITVYFGTNEDNEYEDGNALLETIDAKDMTDDEVEVIKKFFPSKYGVGYGWGFGNTSFVNTIKEITNEK